MLSAAKHTYCSESLSWAIPTGCAGLCEASRDQACEMESALINALQDKAKYRSSFLAAKVANVFLHNRLRRLERDLEQVVSTYSVVAPTAPADDDEDDTLPPPPPPKVVAPPPPPPPPPSPPAAPEVINVQAPAPAPGPSAPPAPPAPAVVTTPSSPPVPPPQPPLPLEPPPPLTTTASSSAAAPAESELQQQLAEAEARLAAMQLELAATQRALHIIVSSYGREHVLKQIEKGVQRGLGGLSSHQPQHQHHHRHEQTAAPDDSATAEEAAPAPAEERRRKRRDKDKPRSTRRSKSKSRSRRHKSSDGLVEEPAPAETETKVDTPEPPVEQQMPVSESTALVVSGPVTVSTSIGCEVEVQTEPVTWVQLVQAHGIAAMPSYDLELISRPHLPPPNATEFASMHPLAIIEPEPVPVDDYLMPFRLPEGASIPPLAITASEEQLAQHRDADGPASAQHSPSGIAPHMPTNSAASATGATGAGPHDLNRLVKAEIGAFIANFKQRTSTSPPAIAKSTVGSRSSPRVVT